MTRFALGFVGAGNMAEAVCRSILAAQVFPRDALAAFDPAPARRRLFADELGVHVAEDNRRLVESCRNVILAVKPQQIAAVLEDLKPAVQPGQLFISVVAGASSAFIAAALGRAVPVIRTMPNTPLLVGAGMTVLCRGREATAEHLAFAERIFAAAGRTLVLDEDRMDAVTAVSGSGPAYFFYLVEAMAAAGSALGLTAQDALTLAGQTALGAATMLRETHLPPEELRRRVTSPGGTTAAALAVLEARGVKDAFLDAVRAAAARSKELGR